MKSVVSIVKGHDPTAMTRKAVELAGGLKGIVKNGDTVLIKPNLVTALPPDSGATTDPRIVRVLVELSRGAGAKEVIIAEGSGGSRTTDAFSVCGYHELSEKMDVRLVDLNSDKKVKKKVKNGFLFESFTIAKTLLDCDVIFSVGKMKTNVGSVMTGNLKNMLGVIPGAMVCPGPYKDQGPKTGIIDLHINGLNYAIVDLNRCLKTSFAVIDALVGMEGKGPADGIPVRMDLILAGADPVATDAVEAAIMGFDPRKILHIQLASEAGLGVGNLNQIEVKGIPIREVARTFRPYFSAHLRDFGLVSR